MRCSGLELQRGADRRHLRGNGIADVDDDRVGRLFERRELAREQRRGHVPCERAASRAAIVSAVALEVDEADIAGAGDAIAVGLLQRRAREHRAAAALVHGRHFGRQPVEPGPAVGVGQRRARRHPGDVRRRMEIVAVEERPAKIRGQRLADRRLAAAGHAHQHDDHRRTPCRAKVPPLRLIATSPMCIRPSFRSWNPRCYRLDGREGTAPRLARRVARTAATTISAPPTSVRGAGTSPSSTNASAMP